MLSAGRTDIGRVREYNQDSFFCETFDNGMRLAVVCDGMGGVAGGGIAGVISCSGFIDNFTEFANGFAKKEKLTKVDERKIKAALTEAAEYANKAVFTRSANEKELRGMGTTLVALLVYCGIAFTVNVGDSRMYLIHSGKITQVTHDHSFVQYLVDAGRMTPEEAKTSPNKNIITRAIGTSETVESDIFTTRLSKSSSRNEYIAVLCSDGLSNHLEPEDIMKLALPAAEQKTDREVGQICETLIEEANRRGGTDNITAVIVVV